MPLTWEGFTTLGLQHEELQYLGGFEMDKELLVWWFWAWPQTKLLDKNRWQLRISYNNSQCFQWAKKWKRFFIVKIKTHYLYLPHSQSWSRTLCFSHYSHNFSERISEAFGMGRFTNLRFTLWNFITDISDQFLEDVPPGEAVMSLLLVLLRVGVAAIGNTRSWSLMSLVLHPLPIRALHHEISPQFPF